MCVAPKRLNFRMSIPSDFRKDWGLFNKRCKVEGMTPADLLQDLIEEYLDEFREEMEKAAGELDEVAGPLRDAPPKKVTIRKPKKKSFLARKSNYLCFKTNRARRGTGRDAHQGHSQVQVIDTSKGFGYWIRHTS